MKIYAPVKDVNGVYASVRFVNGVGETDNPHLIEWFRKRGYLLEQSEFCAQKSLEKSEEVVEPIVEPLRDEVELMGYNDKPTEEVDLEDMTPFELREWALAHGYRLGNARSKAKILEIIREGLNGSATKCD